VEKMSVGQMVIGQRRETNIFVLNEIQPNLFLLLQVLLCSLLRQACLFMLPQSILFLQKNTDRKISSEIGKVRETRRKKRR
jgi:hypothetical protein